MSKFSIPSVIELKNIAENEVILEKKTFDVELQERRELINKVIKDYADIYPPKNRILIAVDSYYKDRVRLGDSNLVLERPRNYNNLNGREVNVSQGWVINDTKVPSGSGILVSHNSFHDTNKVFALENEIELKGVGVYSVPKEECYVYQCKKTNEWLPCDGFLLGLKVFEPYKGLLDGIEPKEIKRAFFVTSNGYLKGKVVETLNASIYGVIFNDENYNEQIINRIRHYPNDSENVREEVICINNELTKKVHKGELLIGNYKTDCKTIK